jgi:hypothetical protein
MIMVEFFSFDLCILYHRCYELKNQDSPCLCVLRHRRLYDPGVTLSDDQIRELVRISTTAPTSFHLQNWRFIEVRAPEAKARLRPIAWDQP